MKGRGLAQAEGAKASGVIPGSQAECIQIRGKMTFMHKGTVDIILYRYYAETKFGLVFLSWDLRDQRGVATADC